MTDKIFTLGEDGTLQSMDKKPYPSEKLLQSLLEKYPDLLAGDQINESRPCRWLHVSREVGVPEDDGGLDRWYLDHLFLDQDAIPTLVEVKQSTNNDTRRKVVGQMLDYAANSVVYWPMESLRAAFETLCTAKDEDPDLLIRELVEADPDDEDPVGKFWEQVKTNLKAGHIRLIFVADEIPKELQRIVEFLNGQMDPAEVLAVEIRQYVGKKSKTLVPRVMGQTAISSGRKAISIGNGQWNETSFFRELETKCSAGDVKAAKRILTWSVDNADRIWWGEGKQHGSFTPIIEHNGVPYYPMAVWTRGVVEVYFYYLKNRPPFDSEDLRMEMLRRLNEVPGISIPPTAVGRGPVVPLSVLNNDAVDKFLGVFDWVLERIRRS